MTRIFLKMFIFLISFSFVTENLLAYKVNSVQCLADDSNDEKSEPLKEKKGDYEEKFFFRQSSTYTTYYHTTLKPCQFSESLFSSGYFDKPFTPPDFI